VVVVDEPKDKQLCPGCKSCDILPLIGGLPGFQAYDMMDRARIPVAECSGSEEGDPKAWRCQDCGREWQEQETEAATANP
jgi:hypothetical protein